MPSKMPYFQCHSLSLAKEEATAGVAERVHGMELATFHASCSAAPVTPAPSTSAYIKGGQTPRSDHLERAGIKAKETHELTIKTP